MADKSLETILGNFKDDDYTVKLVSTVFGVVPGGPEFVFYNNIEGAANRLAPGDAAVLEKAKQLATTEEMTKALWVADKLDMADAGLGVYSGVKNLLSMFGGSKGPEKRTFESDPQQATDAALKAAGLAYMIYKMYPGGVGEKISLYRETPAGQELAIFYAVAEIALPFTDNLVEGGANVVQKLLSKQKGDMGSKFSSVVGSDALAQATGVLDQFTAPLGGYVDQVKGHTGPIAEKVKSFLPSAATAMNVGDSVTGVAATGIDLMPVWRFLGGRVVAEACVLRAMRGV